MNKAEREHLSKVVALGCVVCRNEGFGPTEAEIHHLRSGMGMGQRNDNFSVLPLCPAHHRLGGIGKAFHAGRRTWEANFGTERDLLEQVRGELGDE